MITWDEFKNYYERKGRCYNTAYERKNPLNDTELRKQYRKYVDSYVRLRDFTIDERWAFLRDKVRDRDKYSCRLWQVLNLEEKSKVANNLKGVFKIIDIAHVFEKSVYPHLKYDIDNVVCLYRYFHNRLDSQKDPITGEPVSKEDIKAWWVRIIGDKLYLDLEAKKHD
ncbi:MAG: hypothetical protein GF311_28085 [Candidatus Lokiarchaeota archaeon]|nr:hypothetical protein [Candidatus Lokiarchaeota archaeon]